MSIPFIGEIRCFGFSFAPINWAQCNGQLMQISNFTTLFQVIGTTYGGDGTSTFALPNLQGQVPMHWGTSPGLNTVIGQVQGQAGVSLTAGQIPQHTHGITAGTVKSGSGGERTAKPSTTSFLSANTNGEAEWMKPPVTTDAAFSPKAISQAGNSVPHENMQPYLVFNFCIALDGIFPSHG